MNKGTLKQLRLKARLAIAARKAEEAGATKVKVQIADGGQYGYVRGVKPGERVLSRLHFEKL